MASRSHAGGAHSVRQVSAGRHRCERGASGHQRLWSVGIATAAAAAALGGVVAVSGSDGVPLRNRALFSLLPTSAPADSPGSRPLALPPVQGALAPRTSTPPAPTATSAALSAPTSSPDQLRGTVPDLGRRPASATLANPAPTHTAAMPSRPARAASPPARATVTSPAGNGAQNSPPAGPGATTTPDPGPGHPPDPAPTSDPTENPPAPAPTTEHRDDDGPPGPGGPITAPGQFGAGKRPAGGARAV